MRPLPSVSIVIPVRNEAALVREFLLHVRERAPGAELIVVDGASSDGSADLARGPADRVLLSAPGRARQMNAGAAAASGKALWFLHADSRLPEAPLDAIRAALRDPALVGGCFRLKIPRPEWIYRVSDTLGNLGVDVFRIALGDHGIFCRREAFHAAGGYPELPLMEDAEFYRLLQRHGRVRQLSPSIQTSPRRYEQHGPYRTTFVYALILGLYAARVPPASLARIYRKLVSGEW